ncbi:MAG: phosphate acyltransferase [Gemmatimonadota bacterium]
MGIDTFAALLTRAAQLGPARLAVVAADSPSALHAASEAVSGGMVTAILIGSPDRIRALIGEHALAPLGGARIVAAENGAEAAARAAELANAGEAELLLKGALRTDELLHAVLDRARGLRTGRLLSDVLLYEDTLAGVPRLVGVTDGGLNPAPTPEQLAAIAGNAVAVFHALGFARPRVALLSATEVVSEALASTVAAAELAARAAAGQVPGLREADVAGPLALDNALLESAARAKGITGPVAGRADIMVLPNIEAGNVLGKAVKYLGGSITAHVVVGARVPVLIPSRVESAQDKLHSIALGAVVAAS